MIALTEPQTPTTARTKPGQGSPVSSRLALGRRICRRITRSYARTFYLASHCLPARTRAHAFAIYGFCRWADNAVDDSADRDEAARRLDRAREMLDLAYEPSPAPPGLQAFRDSVRACHIPRSLFDDLLDGMEMDLTRTRYQDFPDLHLYCYRVAGVVGLMMARVFGYRHARCLPRAEALGTAMQLTNILRDVGEDLQRGRIYLPTEEIARFGVSEDQLEAGLIDDRFRDLMRFQIERARRYYRESERGIPDLAGASSRWTVRVMGGLYGGILNEIERNGYDVFRHRARVSDTSQARGSGALWGANDSRVGDSFLAVPGDSPVRAEITTQDPDRYFRLERPGSQEWWYFDALSDDGRDALVVVWYAALPFDPSYGVAAIKHQRDPARYPAPDPLDHCALGMSWYRDGKTVAYALNGFRRPDFSHQSDPFRIDVAGNRLSREANGYGLNVDTPSVDGRTHIRASFHFEPAPGSLPVECNLGDDANPHVWLMAAADCRVEGRMELEGSKSKREMRFLGRGYHDHNAGSDEISLAMKTWAWGRFHLGPSTEVYYQSETRTGLKTGLRITCDRGEPSRIATLDSATEEGKSGNVFGVRHGKSLRIQSGPTWLRDHRSSCVDDGPFYRRWVTRFETDGGNFAPGISEYLDTRNLNRPLFNWMIPYRLKRPRP